MIKYPQGTILIGRNGKRYEVSHFIGRDYIAVYVCDAFGPFGSVVWLDREAIQGVV